MLFSSVSEKWIMLDNSSIDKRLFSSNFWFTISLKSLTVLPYCGSLIFLPFSSLVLTTEAPAPSKTMILSNPLFTNEETLILICSLNFFSLSITFSSSEKISLLLSKYLSSVPFVLVKSFSSTYSLLLDMNYLILFFIFEVLLFSSDLSDFVDVILSDIYSPLISNVEYTQLHEELIQKIRH